MEPTIGICEIEAIIYMTYHDKVQSYATTSFHNHSVAREESRRRHCASPLLSMLDSRPLLTNIPRTQSLFHTTYNLRPSFSSSPVLHSSCTLCIIFAHMHLFHSHSKNGQYFSFNYVHTITYV